MTISYRCSDLSGVHHPPTARSLVFTTQERKKQATPSNGFTSRLLVLKQFQDTIQKFEWFAYFGGEKQVLLASQHRRRSIVFRGLFEQTKQKRRENGRNVTSFRNMVSVASDMGWL